MSQVSSMRGQPIEIVRVVRRMRGGSQAHLVEGQDGLFYIAKFVDNPQGTRTLINEWFTCQLFRQCGVSTPPLRVLRLTKTVQEITEDLVFLQRNTRVAVEPGLHLGSQCPANPETTAIFDFLPRKLLSWVANPEDFAKTLVLDLFLGQADTRQTIFIRERLRNAAQCMRAYMIDHGGALGGSLWQLYDEPRRHLYYDRTIYSFCDPIRECEQALQIVLALTDQNLYQLGESVPAVWFSQNDRADWVQLLGQLSARRRRLPRLLNECLQILKHEQLKGGHRADTSEDVCASSGSPAREQLVPVAPAVVPLG